MHNTHDLQEVEHGITTPMDWSNLMALQGLLHNDYALATSFIMDA